MFKSWNIENKNIDNQIKCARQDKIFILMNHNRTMVQRKTSFTYNSHIMHSTHDKMDSH